jgi:hypothetical protein
LILITITVAILAQVLSNAMVFIYTLELTDNKYYVGKSDNPDVRIENHFDSSGSTWTTTYKPIRCINIIEGDAFDEIKVTLQTMHMYGMDKVRGGPYCSESLSNSERKEIKKLIDSTKDRCYFCKEPGHFKKDCLHYLSSKDIKNKKQTSIKSFFVQR